MESEEGFRIKRLSKSHDRSTFDCGEPSLNRFLKEYASQNARKGISVTYVAVRPNDNRVSGYYSLSSGQVACSDLPEIEASKVPTYPIPVVRIGRLATSLDSRGVGLGRILLIDALQRALVISHELGVYAVEVDAKSEEAKSFYDRYGFQELQDDTLHLYLSIKTVAKLFSGD